jgi:6-phosphogluconolactonase
MMKNKIKVFSNSKALTEAAVEAFVHLAAESIDERRQFTVALSGGSTPQPVYAALGLVETKERVDWEKVHLFWGDERHVPSEHSDSNFGMVQKALLRKIAIPDSNIHRVPAECGIHEAAAQYEKELREFFIDPCPRFDLVLLGMGEDGHTASLFPHSAGLYEEQRWFIANYAPKRETWRLTLTKNAINAARNILVLVSGASKAKMVAEVIKGPLTPESKPIQYISPTDGDMLWLLDEKAASGMG